LDKIIDARVRPPYKSWLQVFWYTQKEWAASIAEQMGFQPAKSYLDSSFDLLLEEMREAGITRALIPGNHAVKPASAMKGASVLGKPEEALEIVPNAEIHELVQRYPNIFAGIVAVDPMETTALPEIERAVRDWKFRAVAIDPGLGIKQLYPDDRQLFPIYTLSIQLHVPVLIKVSHQMGPDLTYGHPLYIGRLAAAFPELSIVVVHGAWPWTREIIAVAHRYKNVYLAPDFYMTFPGREDYVEAANTFLGDRLIYASGYPILPVGAMLQYVKALPFKPGVLRHVLYDNAARLFNLS
jgi:uncharacterized protein